MRIKIKEIIQETPDTITLVFDVPRYSWQYEAGQFVTLGLSINDVPVYRNYSFATNPYLDPFPAVTIKRVPQGKFSNYIHDHVRPGSELECIGPQGNFTMTYQPNQKRHCVFIAGGSGITPLFSMIKTLLQQEPHTTISLLYANRNQHYIIYRTALAALEKAYADRLQVRHFLSQPLQGWKGHKGRLTAALLLACLPKEVTQHYYFLCAPTGLMDTVRTALSMAGVAAERIRYEDFNLPLLHNKSQGVLSTATIYYEGDAYTCTISPGETLLEAAMAQGIPIPYACSSGMCNVCRAKCLQGKVHMLADEGLSEEEKKEGYVLTCVGYPTSATITIAIEE